MSMQHQFRAVAPQHRAQFRAIGQRLAPPDRALGRRMMQHQHAHPPGRAFSIEHFGQPRELRPPQPAARKQGRPGTRRIQAHERHFSAGMNEWPALRRARPGGPAIQSFPGRHRDQGVVIARHQADAPGRGQIGQPGGGTFEFFRQGEIDDVARDRDMIEIVRPQIHRQCIEDFCRLEHAPATPRPYAQLTLGEALPSRKTRLERQMQIRDMREHEGFHWIMRGCASGRVDYAIPVPPLLRPLRMNTRARATPGVRIVGDSPLRIWSLASPERLARQFARIARPNAGRVILVRADWVYDDALLRGLVASNEEVALVADDGSTVAASVEAARADAAEAALARSETAPGLRPLAPAALAGEYNNALRKREPPVLLPLTEATLPAVERRVFGASYKGVTDLVTRHVWPAPARIATRWCAHAGITPNQVTSASLVLVLAALALFWQGHYGPGLVAAWLMTFLDTVDGKLARVTLQSTKWGNAFDHGIDLIHPPFWWWAWIVGLPAAGLPLPLAGPALAAIIAGYVLQRVEEGIFLAAFGMDMHVWRPFDSFFRLVTARRNPNLLILTVATLGGRPDLGILAVAAWTLLCLGVHALRIALATMARRHGPLRSWLED